MTEYLADHPTPVHIQTYLPTRRGPKGGGGVGGIET